jgi:SAM-dependent methyltransferase
MKYAPAQQVWDREYTDPIFTSFNREPHQVVKDFLKHLRRKEGFLLEGKTFFDIGCGIGKDVQYAIENYDMKGIGCDVSPVAIKEAMQQVPKGDFFVHNLEERMSVKDGSVDVAVMVMVIHALSQKGREICLREVARTLKPGGYFFLKTLALEGDAHAKYLIKNSPGEESNSFIHPDLRISEYVHTKESLKSDVEKYFEVISLEKTSGYQKWGQQSYKRNYWVAYLKKK